MNEFWMAKPMSITQFPLKCIDAVSNHTRGPLCFCKLSIENIFHDWRNNFSLLHKHKSETYTSILIYPKYCTRSMLERNICILFVKIINRPFQKKKNMFGIISFYYIFGWWPFTFDKLCLFLRGMSRWKIRLFLS